MFITSGAWFLWYMVSLLYTCLGLINKRISPFILRGKYNSPEVKLVCAGDLNCP